MPPLGPTRAMCQLLALTFNERVTTSLSFRGFRHRSDCNPHGWGLATFDGHNASIVKEPCRADESDEVESIVNNHNLSSKIFVGHVRYGNVGFRSKTRIRLCKNFEAWIWCWLTTARSKAISRRVMSMAATSLMVQRTLLHSPKGPIFVRNPTRRGLAC